jgi:hypothetical protein
MIPFGEYLPDIPATENPGATVATNVIPAAISYRPLPDLTVYSSALTARCQGFASFRDLDGNVHNFAGDATKLYKLSNTSWEDVSGTTYATGSDARWSFAQFGNFVVATNFTDSVQSYEMGTSTDFAALAGSPPKARYAAPVRDFMVLGHVSSFAQRVRWSAIDDVEDWTVDPDTQADFQDFPDGGAVQGLAGGEYGVVLQEFAIRRMTYIGSPVIFQIDEIERGRGCMAPGSVAQVGQMVFFLADDGFYVLLGGREARPIGNRKVDRTFLADLDDSYIHRITSVIDPTNKLYIVSYPGTGSSDGTPNKLIIYNYAEDKWSTGEIEIEHLASSRAQGYTLESLDSINSSIDALPYSLDSSLWAGGTVNLSAFNTSHKLSTFTGSNLAARLETGEAQLVPGKRTFVQSVRPMVDGGTLTVTLGTRNRINDSVTYGSAVSQNTWGECPVRANARYHRARVDIAAGGSWTHAQGVDFQAVPEGSR